MAHAHPAFRVAELHLGRGPADTHASGGPGLKVWAPAGVEHGVTNTRTQPLVLLVGIAPAPDK